MSRKFFKYFLIAVTLSFCYSLKFHQKGSHQLLLDFTCATAKDEHEKHPEMRTIAIVELENNFPSDFSREVLKCLPPDVAKIIINPHGHGFYNTTFKLPKESLVIYVADKVGLNETFFSGYILFGGNFPIVSHLSKHLIVGSNETEINKTKTIDQKLLNVAQVYEKNEKVIAKSFDMTKNLPSFVTFESSQVENLSKILFPDKAKNLNGQEIFVFWHHSIYVFNYPGGQRPNCKWTPYLNIIAEKLNATISFNEFKVDKRNWETMFDSRKQMLKKFISNNHLDFYLNFDYDVKSELESYNNEDWCLLAPVPKPYDLTELILFLPMDKSCWMWLGITIAASTLIWRISEGHWSFAFGFFSYFMGQAQLTVRIRTNRLTMKILLQILIFAIFIFSTAYQSLVTSFMLDPLKYPVLKTIDEFLDSDLNIVHNGKHFKQKYEENPKHQKLEEDGRVLNLRNRLAVKGRSWMDEMIKLKFVMVQPCKISKVRYAWDTTGNSYKGIYVIPEFVVSLPYDLYTRPYHPLLDIFQQLMDRSLETGLHQAWERKFWKVWREDTIRRRGRAKNKQTDPEMLDFSMIAPSLYILAFGLPTALLMLFCEIFCKDFVTQLSREYFKRKWKEFLMKNVQKEKPNVRVIQVKARICKTRHSI